MRCQTLNKYVSISCLSSPSSMSLWRKEVGRLFESRGPVTAKLLMSKSKSELLLVLCKCLCRLSEDNGRMSSECVCHCVFSVKVRWSSLSVSCLCNWALMNLWNDCQTFMTYWPPITFLPKLRLLCGESSTPAQYRWVTFSTGSCLISLTH